MSKIKVLKPYDRLYKTKKRRIIMYAPRISGKSKGMSQFLVTTCRRYPGADILVARANYNALSDSLLNEILEVQEDIDFAGFFKLHKMPLELHSVLGNRISFKGIGGSDTSRTRGIKSAKKQGQEIGGNLALVVIDEAQQLKDEMQLKHALATFMRNLNPNIDSKIIIAGNPEQPKGHWWNNYCKRMRDVDSYEFIDATYQDIAKVLPKDTLEDIELERELNPAQYKFMYLGSLDDLMGGAYGQFKREKHFITEDKVDAMFPGETIHYVIFGTDGAIAHDATCICPIAILSSGRALVLERFYYDPIATGIVLSTSQLMEYIKPYLEYLENKYQFTRCYCEKIFAVDCASADLIAQLRYSLDDTYIVKSYTNKSIVRNNNVVNNAFAKGVLYIKDFGGQYLWDSGKIMRDDPLVNALESVVWKNYKLDPAIPNDTTDALTYGVNYYFENPDNLAFPERQKAYK